MPELPEVQTIVSDLNYAILHQKIVSFESTFSKAIKDVTLATFKKKIIGSTIIAIERIGKNILINLDNRITILVHLKMTGQLITRDTRYKIQDTNKHLHHCFILEKGSLCFYDIRKFGTLTLISTEKIGEKFSKLGVDPLSRSFNREKLKGLLGKSRTKNIKMAIMDQRLIAGIGNIYASEILFDAKISPHKKSDSLSSEQISSLYRSIKTILKKAVLMRGTSVSDYRDASGKKGRFQKVLRVYKKNGQKCQACGTIIEKIVIGQRSTFYCPNCQK